MRSSVLRLPGTSWTVSWSPGYSEYVVTSQAAMPQRSSAPRSGVAPLQVDAPQVHLCDEQGWIASFVLAEELRADAAAGGVVACAFAFHAGDCVPLGEPCAERRSDGRP